MHFYRYRSRCSPNCSRRSTLKTRIYFSRWSHNLVQEKRPYPSVMTGILGYPDSFLGSPPFSEGAKCSVTYKGYREASNFSAFAIFEVGITSECRGNTVLSRSTKVSRCPVIILFMSACLTVISRDVGCRTKDESKRDNLLSRLKRVQRVFTQSEKRDKHETIFCLFYAILMLAAVT